MAPDATGVLGPASGARQRLWVLERTGTDTRHAGVCRFTSAFAVLEGSRVCVFFVRSPDARAGHHTAQAAGLRLNVERDARRFGTLDAALAWADSMRQAWTSRGWTEVAADPRDR